MKDSDKKQFAIMMGEMGVAFSHDVTQEILRVYFKRLSSCSLYQVTRAIDQCINHEERFPVFSHLNTLACSFKREPSRHIIDAQQIEETSTFEGAPKSAEDFFQKVDELLGKKQI